MPNRWRRSSISQESWQGGRPEAIPATNEAKKKAAREGRLFQFSRMKPIRRLRLPP